MQYAGASGDYNPVHTDEVFATQAAGFPSVFAHGMLTMGLTARALTEWVGDDALTTAGPAKFAGAADRMASSELAVQATGTADAVPLTPQSVPDGIATLRGAQPPATPGQRAPPTASD